MLCLLIILRAILGNVVGSWLIKHIVETSLTKKFFLMYLSCALFVTLIAIAIKTPIINIITPAILLMGIVNAFAAYMQWHAIKISLSRTSIFTFWDDIIAMYLSYFLLKEGKFLNFVNLTGIIICLTVTISYAYYRFQTNDKGKKVELSFFLYVGIYSVIWGILMFLMKYLGFKNIPVTQFLWGWYVGSFLSSIFLLIINGKKESLENQPLKFKDVALTACMSAVIAICLGLGYWAYKLAPQIMVQPLMLISEMILPTIVGFYVFKEIKSLKKYEKFFYVAAVIGGLLIILGS